VRVFPDQKHQKMLGFGGAITDSSMKILDDLSKSNSSLNATLFNQYYGPSGISYNLGRVPIASCDFSVTNYSYLDKAGDFELKSFRLSKFEYKKVGINTSF
jgi:glucosylceramidase